MNSSETLTIQGVKPSVDINVNTDLRCITSGQDVTEDDLVTNSSTSQSSKHREEWIKGSGISEEITYKSLESLTDRKAIAKILGWKGYPDHNPLGWVAHGISLVTLNPLEPFQFKPDTPILLNAEDEKPAKYITSKIFYDAIALPIRDWKEILEDPSYPLVITEGAKKTAALETCGYAALGLAGVEMGLNNGRLVPNLDAIATEGRPTIFCYDADIATKPEVQKALQRNATPLKKKGSMIYVVPPWDISLGKGIDDVLANHGPEKVKEIMNTAIPYKQWLKGLERQFQPAQTSSKRIKPADLIARDIADEYRSQLAFNNESGLWMRYEADSPGVWSPESPEFIESLVYQVLTSKGISGFGGNAYITNIVKILRHQLICRKWIERSPSELIPFKNGVLEVETGKLLEHNPGYRFTWSMPREHNSLAKDWGKIEAFLDTVTNGNQDIKTLLICFCNAVLKGRSDLQKFLHLTGPGGSGKGTFTRLLTDLIGQNNTHTSTLEDWCGNRFESANAYRKRLIAFPDEDKKVGNLGKFKSLTGEDLLRAEEKGQKAFQFRFEGMVCVSSNFPIFAGDTSSGLTRRTILVPFTHVPKPRDRRNLNQDFQAELSAFTNYLLSIPDEQVTATLLGTKDIQELNHEFWASRQRTDSIAAWLNDWVIYDPLAATPIGSDRHEGKEKTPVTLYGSYCLHAHQSGNQAKSIKNFSPDLLELCSTILGWTVEKVATKQGKLIKGLRLRTNLDDHIPTYEMQIETPQSTGDGLGDGLVTDAVTAGTLTEQASDGCDGLNQVLREKKESDFNSQIEEKNDFMVTDSNPLPVEPVISLIQQAIDPSPDPSSDPSPDPSPDKPNYSNFPHLTSGDNRAKKKRATTIKEAMLICSNKEELTRFKAESGYNESEIQWVYKNALTKSEREQIKTASTISQPSLFQTEGAIADSQPSGQWVEATEGMTLCPGQWIHDKVTKKTYQFEQYDPKTRRYECIESEGYFSIPIEDALIWVTD